VLAIIPFFLFILTCVVEQSFEKPGRTSTDRMESLQVLKLVRILKLARHFEGARVLWLALQVIIPPSHPTQSLPLWCTPPHPLTMPWLASRAIAAHTGVARGADGAALLSALDDPPVWRAALHCR